MRRLTLLSAALIAGCAGPPELAVGTSESALSGTCASAPDYWNHSEDLWYAGYTAFHFQTPKVAFSGDQVAAEDFLKGVRARIETTSCTIWQAIPARMTTVPTAASNSHGCHVKSS